MIVSISQIISRHPILSDEAHLELKLPKELRTLQLEGVSHASKHLVKR